MKWRQLMAALLGAAALVGVASAAHVTIALVTPSEGKMVSIEARQALWKSPFGGWGVTVWPFALRVDDTLILEYQSAAQKLMAAAGESAAPGDRVLDSEMRELTGEGHTVRPGDLMTFRLDRRASVTLDLAEGRHTLRPFGIEFTVAGDGTVASPDPRLRVDAKDRRVEVICHPVTVKMIAGNRSVFGPLEFACASTSLLGGLNNVFAEYDKQRRAKPGTAASAGFRRLTLYLPASAPGAAYAVNGVKFGVDAEGRVRLAADAKARCPDGREIRLLLPAAEPVAAVATQPLGVSWFGAPGEVTIACGSTSVAGGAGTGSAWLPVPAAGNRTLKLGEMTVRLPAADPRWPHALLVWDVAGGACWAVETAPLAAKPGARWSCRIGPLTGKTPVLPAALKVRLHAVAGGRAAGDMALTVADGSVYASDLPAEPGLWRLRVADESGPLPRGQTLGMVRIGGEAQAAVSLFNFRNRGIVRRGDATDVLWSARLPAGRPAVEWPVILRGTGLEVQIGKIAASGSAAAGAFRLETAALAPGAYEVAVADPALVCYPMRFLVVQKELESDFEVSSFDPIVGAHSPYPGSPVLLYKNHAIGGPGLDPFRGDADTALDAALATYADAPAGPAIDKFNGPTPEERDLMAVAALGMRSMPPYPEMLSQESYNPKHTLPEDLEQMRRRMALVVQPRADVPGLDGFGLGWHPKVWGFWEGVPRLDGHQGRRNTEANKWGGARFDAAMKKHNADQLPEVQKKELGRWQGARAWGSILPHAFAEWFADARRMRPGLTLHNTKPTGWGHGGVNYPPAAYAGLSHRDALDYSDYCIQAWQNFIVPPILGMGNQAKQKLSMSFFNHDIRAEEIPIAFGAAGRGLDGFSLSASDHPQSENLLRIFARFGSWIAALDPLPDVAVYFNDNAGIPIALHDLARLRRPGMAIAPEDVLAGELFRYKVLLLLGVQAFELPEIDKAVRDFEARGGVIIKDDACHERIPGRKLGFVYAKHNHGAWHLSSNGEWPFAVMWDGFKNKREKILVEAFAETPRPPVTTPDASVIISPLAGKESILCFVINQTLVPLEIKGRWRQYVVLPKIGELRVEKGWHVHDVLAGKAAPVEETPQGQRVAVDFTRLEGAVYLLTKREPRAMAIKAERTGATTLRLTGWLADAGEKPMADPMPFEVTLRGPDGATLFHKFAALGPELALDVPVPALSGEARLELAVRDLVLGSTATQAVAPAAPAAVEARTTPDLIGGAAAIKAFLAERKGPVTVVLDERQEVFRPAAEQVAALLKKSGREARVVTWDLADIRPLHLRWKWTRDDLDVLDSLKDGSAWAWRIAMSSWAVEKVPHDYPSCGYDEYGPRLRHDADVVLFGAPPDHRALMQLEPYLRRLPTDDYPAPGGYFVHYLYSPFLGGYDGLYVGCHGAAGAEAAVACLAALPPPEPAAAPKMDARPVVARGGALTPLENMVDGKFGVYILDAVFAPSGKHLFVTTTSYGDWFYVFSPSGEIIEKRTPPNTPGFPNWYQWGRGGLRPESDTALRIRLWNGEYLYDLERGYVARSAGEPPHHLPGPGDGGGPVVRGATRLEDYKTGITYVGGMDRVTAMDKQGRFLWRFDDSEVSGNIAFPRGTFTRALSGDGRVLLVSAFAVAQALYATRLVNPSIMGLDAATGKLLWQRQGVFLSEGKAVALDDRFIVAADNGESYEIIAADGREGKGMSALTGSADWVLQLPGRKELLIVENCHFSRRERTARVYIRRLDGSGEQDLAVPGRVADAKFAPDGKSFVLACARGRTLCFALDGSLLWDAETPAARLARFAPDSRTVVIGAYDGVVHFLDAANGEVVRRVDLNGSNVITGEQFVNQECMVGEVPQDVARTVPPGPPEPSYLNSLDPKKVAFGPNLAPPERMRALLEPAKPAESDPARAGYVGKLTKPVTLAFKVKAGTTYLVEMLNAVADPADYTPLLRLEVAVTGAGARNSKNLPYTARLPLGRYLARRRAAFRADAAGEVTLTLRAVLPHTIGEGRKASTTYEKAPASGIPALLGDVVVSAIRFPGRSLLFDGGPTARSNPSGTLTCTAYPWQNGTNTPKTPYDNPRAALRLVNGIIANQETAWAGAGGVEYADVVAEFEKARELSAVAMYEDASGPVPGRDSVRERASMRYSVHVRNAADRRWTRIGLVHDNTQLINIFECPAFEIDRIRCVWSGHHDYLRAAQTDGSVRTAQIEAYAADELVDLEDVLNDKDDGLRLD